MHKQETKTQTQTTVWWLPEGMRVGVVQGKGGKYKVIEGDLTLGGEHTMQYTDGVSWTCTLETHIIVLTNVTPQNF